MDSIGFILDAVMIALLAGTIYMALRLSRSLDAFRATRADIQIVMRDLAENIMRAQQAIDQLGDTSRVSGERLQQLINQGRALSDELQIINEAGDNLAERLEKLASRARETHGAPGAQDVVNTDDDKRPSFAVRDPDGGRTSPTSATPLSRAERDLADALARSKR